MSRPRSSAFPLALLYVLLVVYASLYPFMGWTWPPGHALTSLMRLKWPHWHQNFDIFANLAGYLPLGALVYVAGVRSARRPAMAGGVALLGPALLSYITEVIQNFIPGRVPSLEDWLYNTMGAALGLLLAAALHATGLLDRWQVLRDRWFAGSSGGARVLMLIWPIALLFPTPVPLGLGQF
ncbi:MAG TPA: VanZ family protein, partial [Burkholderiaceae bacterium]|nr:VanZ family protein [Burkholderiaceae bacterium]